MDHHDGGEVLQRLLQVLAEAETALAGPGPQAPRQAVQLMDGAAAILRQAMPSAGRGDGEQLLAARRRLERIQRLVEFGSAYWSGLVSCTVAAEAYGPGLAGACGALPTGDLHG